MKKVSISSRAIFTTAIGAAVSSQHTYHERDHRQVEFMEGAFLSPIRSQQHGAKKERTDTCSQPSRCNPGASPNSRPAILKTADQSASTIRSLFSSRIELLLPGSPYQRPAQLAMPASKKSHCQRHFNPTQSKESIFVRS